MNGGPFRAPQSNEGGMINNRQSPAPSRQPEAPRAEPVEPPQPVAMPQRNSAPAPVRSQPPKQEKTRKALIVSLCVGAIVAALVAMLILLPLKGSSISSAIEGDKYQAVFFTNGQVYFGKLSQENADYLKLTNVFYLQAKDSTTETDASLQQATDGASNDVQLIKLGNEIHGPQDEMVISKDQVLFFENLKADGKVATSIEQYNKTNAKK